MHHVYHLVDPQTRAVRYVGKSRQPTARLRAHISEAAARQVTEKQAWIAALAAAGQKPVLVIVASYTDEPSARRRESAEVHQHRATALNQHDPAKGAKDLRPAPRRKPNPQPPA